jgi:Tol biopolymer transport system component
MKHFLRNIAVTAVAASTFTTLPRVPASATYAATNGDILYATSGAVRAISQDGSRERVFTSLRGGTEGASVSSDGTIAAIGDMTDRGARILVLDLDNDTRSVVLPVRRAPTDEIFSVALSPDGNTIVFCDGFPGNLWTIGIDGSALTELAAKGYCYADWGSSGRIVASKGIFPSDGDRVVATMDADGENKTVIATMPPSKQAWNIVYVLRPSWAPDGSAVVFAAQRTTARPDVWWVGEDGSNLHRLTHTFSTSESGPVFSPDGSKVVFASLGRHAGDSSLRLMDSNGTHIEPVTDTPDRDDYPLAWRAA